MPDAPGVFNATCARETPRMKDSEDRFMFVYPPLRVSRPLCLFGLVLIALGSAAAPARAQTTVTLGTPGTHINADLMIQGGSAATTDFSGSDVLATKAAAESYTRRMF